MKILALAALLVLTACSEVPDQVPDRLSDQLHGKLLCLHETNEAYTARKNIGNNMLIQREVFADPLCKERK